jgi:hypothetical protein
MIISLRIILRIGNISHKVVDKIKTHILCSIIFSRKSRPLWGNVGKYGRDGQAADDDIIRRTCFACWIAQAKIKIHRVGVRNTYCFSMLTIFTRTPSMLHLYLHCLTFIKNCSKIFSSYLTENTDYIHCKPKCVSVLLGNFRYFRWQS